MINDIGGYGGYVVRPILRHVKLEFEKICTNVEKDDKFGRFAVIAAA